MAEQGVNEARTTPLPIYSDVEINNLPDPEWLVEGLFQERTVAALYGPTEAGKTFVALDLALSIATGRSFHGLEVVQAGVVVYVYAEGGPNLKFRVQAWKQEQSFRLEEPCNVLFIPTSVNLTDDRGSGLKDLLKTARTGTSEPIALVVIDTLAACFGGKNEDSTQDMNSFTNRCAKIRDELGCTVLVVHHTGRDSSRERGNLSLKNNIDTMIRCSRVKKGIVELECEKQKDAPYFEPFQLILEEVQLSEEQTSCVLRSPDQEQSELPLLESTERSVLEILTSFGPDGATFTEWCDKAVENGLSESAFKRNRAAAIRDRLVNGPRGSLRGFRYTLTENGKAALGDDRRVQTPLDPNVGSSPVNRALGSHGVHRQSIVNNEDKVGSRLGSDRGLDPSDSLGSRGGAYRAPHEPNGASEPETTPDPNRTYTFADFFELEEFRPDPCH